VIRAGVIAAVALVAAAPPAAADATKVFPLAGTLRGDAAGAPAAMTAALVTALDAEVAAVAIDDAASVLGCAIDDTSCLAAIARSLSASRLVFGSVATAGGRAQVTVTTYTRGEAAAHRTFALAGTTPDELAVALIADAGPFLGVPAPVEADPPGPAADPTAIPAAPPPAPAPRRGTPRYAWGVIAGGVVLAGVGGGFLWSARSLRDDVARAPTATRDEVDRLLQLEATGRRRTRIGGALAIAGGAVVITGVVLAIVHRGGDREARDASAVRVEPALVPGGAMVVLSIGGP
jgi:hypothetical protein